MIHKRQYIAENILTGQVIVSEVKDVAARTGVSVSTLHKYCRYGRPYKNKWRFRLESEMGEVQKTLPEELCREWDRVRIQVRKAMTVKVR